MVAMDSTIVNVALPSIRADLRATLSDLQWVIDAYTIVLASFLMLGGATADRYGRRRVFQIGMLLFTGGSLLCSLAGNVHLLIAARVIQALGGSMLNPVAMSIIVHTFPEPRERARAIGVWGAMAGISMALGPIAGGVLTQSLGWHAVFWVNVPVGLLALALTARYVPESRAPVPRRPDPIGQTLLFVGLGSLAFCVIEGARQGLAVGLPAGVLAATCVGLLVIYEPRRREPLLDLRFFRSIPFSSATLIAVCMFAALGSMLFLNTLYLQNVRGNDAFHAGLCLLPMAAMVMIVSPLSGRLVGSRGARPSLLVSGLMLTLSALLLVRLSTSTPLPQLLLAYALFGTGFGMVNAPVTYAAVSGMPRAQAGLAAAIASTSRQVGTSLGVAVAGALVGRQLGISGVAWTQLPAASHAMWWALAGAGLVILALGALSTSRRAHNSAARVAHLLDA